jgi:DNA-binding NtrC family response regulator
MTVLPIRLLVLEDDPSLSEVLCDSMRDRGHAPVPARSVAEAVQLLERTDFEVALLDLMLPDGSGLDVLRRIVEESLPMEAIVLTGYATVDTALQAMKLGAYDYQTKPARIDELEVLVEKAAERRACARRTRRCACGWSGRSRCPGSSRRTRACATCWPRWSGWRRPSCRCW